jgi:predicted Fe-Mo cluster-binding NifX family protein
MCYKIAVGSSDGKLVNEHFGGCGRFLIIEVDSELKSYKFAGFRSAAPPCADGEHSEYSLEAAAEALSDCRIVMVGKIGPPAELALRRRYIDVIEYHGLIEDAMKRILQYYR